MSNFYKFSTRTLDGHLQDFAKFQDKVVLVVNTASKCGFTRQYAGLEKLYQTYKDDGLVIIGFPCNQFGNQEPGTPEEIREFCDYYYDISFPMMDKVSVNGEHTHPLFAWLKNEKGGFLNNAIKWNFTKFLINRKGRVLARYPSAVQPEDLADDIENALGY